MAKSKSSGLKERFSLCFGWGLIILGAAIVLQALAHLDQTFAAYRGDWIPASAAGSVALSAALVMAGATRLRQFRRDSREQP